MTFRFLPPEEWNKLDGTPLGAVREQMSPDTTQVLAGVDDQGRVIGTWAIVILPHLEGMWVDPAHQSKASVAKGLLRGMFTHLREAGLPQILTHAPGPTVDHYLTRLGGTPLPGRAFLLPIPAEF